jgi:hypothetical protein
VLLHERVLAEEMGRAAVVQSARFTWSIAAARLRRLYGDYAARAPLSCS